MREIRFRAWKKEEKKMINIAIPSIFNMEDSVMMQFTGLKDKKGKEIYEGDILYSKFLELYYVVKFTDTPITNKHDSYADNVECWCEEVINPEEDDWDSDLYWDEKEDDMRVRFPIKDKCSEEIMGNIYENPELLEAKDETNK